MRAQNATFPYITLHDSKGAMVYAAPLYPQDDTPLPLGSWVVESPHLLDQTPPLVHETVLRYIEAYHLSDPHLATLTYLAN